MKLPEGWTATEYALYEVNGDLYVNDGYGVAVKVTSGDGLAAIPMDAIKQSNTKADK